MKRPAAAAGAKKQPAVAATEAERSGKRGKTDAAQAQMKPKEIAALIASSKPWKASLRPGPRSLSRAALHVLSWNVNGLDALLKARPRALQELVAKEHPDVVLLQETKLQDKNVEALRASRLPEGWNSHWLCSKDSLGYAGVAALWRPGLQAKVMEGLGLGDADREGRCLTLELLGFYVVGCYAPNSGEGLKRLNFRIQKWEPAVASHLQKLQAKKPVLYCGDLNVCHKELDLWGNHGPNSKGAGYTPQERQALTDLLSSSRLVDSFRHKHPDARGFSYWSYRFNCRAKNNGWRIDYCLVSASLAGRLHDAYLLPEVSGSDHCPVGVVIK